MQRGLKLKTELSTICNEVIFLCTSARVTILRGRDIFLKRYVRSADYVHYNANAQGRNSQDCVKRALSMAFDISYNDISKELLSTAKRLNSSAWNVPPVFGDVIESHGGIKKSVIGPRLNVSDFIDENCTSGTYLLLTSSTPTSRSHHIICVIDGKLYDSWDSSNEYVVSYYVVPEISTRNFTNITEEFESLMLYAIDCLEKCLKTFL